MLRNRQRSQGVGTLAATKMNSKLNTRQFIKEVSVLTVFSILSIFGIYVTLFSKGFNRDLEIWLNYLISGMLTIFPFALIQLLMNSRQIIIDKETIMIKRIFLPNLIIKRDNLKTQVICIAQTSRSQKTFIYNTKDNRSFTIRRGLHKNFGSLTVELNKDKDIIFWPPFYLPRKELFIWLTLIITVGTMLTMIGSR